MRRSGSSSTGLLSGDPVAGSPTFSGRLLAIAPMVASLLAAVTMAGPGVAGDGVRGRVFMPPGATLAARAEAGVRPSGLPTDFAQTGWETVAFEGFEQGFPGTGWSLFPRTRTDLPDAPYVWDNESFNPRTGSFSGWCAGFSLDAPAFPQLDPSRDPYVPEMDSWMVFGSVDLTEATQSEIEFSRWLDCEPGDTLFVGASADGVEFFGFFYTGHEQAWLADTLDVVRLIGVDPRDAPEVWVAWVFFSDDVSERGAGVFIDDIAISRFIPGPDCALSTESLEFGTVPVDEPVDRSFRIENPGTETITGQITFSCSDFAIVGSDSYSIPPEGETTITVRFQPRAGGVATCDLQVGSDELCPMVSCRGEGVIIVNEPPFIAHSPVLTASANLGLALVANVTDPEAGSLSARLYYRRGGDAGYAELGPSQQAGSTYSFLIPPALVTSRGVEYYLAADDGNSTVTVPPLNPLTNPLRVTVAVLSLSSPQPQPAGDAQTAYRLVSVPGEREVKSVESIFFDDLGEYDDTQWRLFRYRQGSLREYPDPSAALMEPGQSSWLIVRESGKRLDSGPSRSFPTAEPFHVRLEPGWNDVANPFDFPLAPSSVTSTGNVDGPYAYEGAWRPPSEVGLLEPWSGYAYFLFDANSADLVMAPLVGTGRQGGPSAERPACGPEPPRASRIAQPAPVELATGMSWALDLQVQAGAARDSYNRLGLALDAGVGKDAGDYLEPRGVGEFVSLSFIQPDGSRWTSDLRGSEGTGQAWPLELQTNLADPLVVSWTSQGTLPAGWGLRVIDPLRGLVFAGEAGAIDVTVTPAPANEAEFGNARSLSRGWDSSDSRGYLLVMVGTADFLAEGARAFETVRLELTTPRPNPFRAETSFWLRVPGSGPVDLAVIDPAGRLVRSLGSGPVLGPEFYSWDGRDDAGREVPSGIYWIRARTPQATASRRVVSIR